MAKSIFEEVNDKGGDDRWRKGPSDNGAMFDKWRDVGDKDHPEGILVKTKSGKSSKN